ncbi:hypothetical protein Tco_0149203 [Tanacetum coccineum]
MDTFPGSTDEETSKTKLTDKNITIGTTGKNILSYEDTIEKYVPVVKYARKRPPGNSADKGKGKANV